MSDSDWDIDLTGAKFKADDRCVKFEGQLKEVGKYGFAQCHALTFVHDVETKEQFMLKIRYE